MWYVYLLECADTSFYCGVTNDLTRRLAAHNGERHGGARYTQSRRPVRILCSLPCADKSFALRVENALKKIPRERKQETLRQLGAVFLSERNLHGI